MKQVCVLLLFLLFSFNTSAQHRFTLELGLGFPAFNTGLYNGVSANSSCDPNFNIGLNYLHKISNHFYAGSSFYFDQYSFSYGVNEIDTLKNRGGSIAHRSSYFFVAPMLDLGIGRHQYLHTYIAVAYGFLIKGSQRTNTYYYTPLVTEYNNTYPTNTEINKQILRIDLGITQHIRIDNMWHITISECYSFIPGTLTTLDNPINTSLGVHPGYFNFKIGVMHKYIRTGWQNREE